MTSKTFVARQLASKLFTAENSLDHAIDATAALTSTVTQTRTLVRGSAAMIQPALKSIATVIGELAAAQEAMVRSHQYLAEAQHDLGMRERNFGGFIDKPEKEEKEKAAYHEKIQMAATA